MNTIINADGHTETKICVAKEYETMMLRYSEWAKDAFIQATLLSSAAISSAAMCNMTSQDGSTTLAIITGSLAVLAAPSAVYVCHKGEFYMQRFNDMAERRSDLVSVDTTLVSTVPNPK